MWPSFSDHFIMKHTGPMARELFYNEKESLMRIWQTTAAIFNRKLLLSAMPHVDLLTPLFIWKCAIFFFTCSRNMMDVQVSMKKSKEGKRNCSSSSSSSSSNRFLGLSITDDKRWEMPCLSHILSKRCGAKQQTSIVYSPLETMRKCSHKGSVNVK